MSKEFKILTSSLWLNAQLRLAKSVNGTINNKKYFKLSNFIYKLRIKFYLNLVKKKF